MRPDSPRSEEISEPNSDDVDFVRNLPDGDDVDDRHVAAIREWNARHQDGVDFYGERHWDAMTAQQRRAFHERMEAREQLEAERNEIYGEHDDDHVSFDDDDLQDEVPTEPTEVLEDQEAPDDVVEGVLNQDPDGTVYDWIRVPIGNSGFYTHVKRKY